MLTFTTTEPPLLLRFAERGYQLRVYYTMNPTDLPNRDALSYLVGQTVLIDGVERVVAGWRANASAAPTVLAAGSGSA